MGVSCRRRVIHDQQCRRQEHVAMANGQAAANVNLRQTHPNVDEDDAALCSPSVCARRPARVTCDRPLGAIKINYPRPLRSLRSQRGGPPPGVTALRGVRAPPHNSPGPTRARVAPDLAALRSRPPPGRPRGGVVGGAPPSSPSTSSFLLLLRLLDD